MPRILVFIAAILTLCGIGLAWVVTAARPAFGEAEAARSENGDPVRGKIVFDAGQCSSCHAGPGGPAAAGRRPRARLAPWHLPPAQHLARPGARPADALPFPLTIRRGVGFWKLLFLEHGPIPEDPARDAAWNRGHYLTEAVAHCAECHSTRNLLGAIRPETRFAGGPDQEGTGYVPNITPQAIGHRSVEDLAEVLTTGRTPDLRVVRSSMDDVVRNMAALPEEERRAIAAYIHSLPARPTPGFSN